MRELMCYYITCAYCTIEVYPVFRVWKLRPSLNTRRLLNNGGIKNG